MNPKTFAISMSILATFYLGCTNPNTVIDPRTPAATALSTATPEVTGYWMVESLDDEKSEVGHIALKQLPDGAVIGESRFYFASDSIVKGSVSGNIATVELWVRGGKSPMATLAGEFAADGTAILGVTEGPRQGHQLKLTKLF